MITISVKQPWAYLLCAGIKDIENRTWRLPEKHKGKRVLIHASTKWDDRHRNMSHLFTNDQWEAMDENTRRIMAGGVLDTSAIIGSVVFTDCVINHQSVWAEKTQFYVELEEGVYLTSGQGDPSRTVLLEHAHLYVSEYEANRVLHEARKYRPFMNAKVIANKPIYNWVASDPVLFDKPVLNVKGKLSFWDYPNIGCEQDEDGKDICCCHLGIDETDQVLSYGGGDYRCKYCGGKWYK